MAFSGCLKEVVAIFGKRELQEQTETALNIHGRTLFESPKCAIGLFMKMIK
jgi:hypothetical protein